MLQVKIINKINFPEIKLQSTLEEIAEQIILPDIESGIDNGRAITGGQLPDNEPLTIKKKNKVTSKRLFTQKGSIRAGALKQIEKTGLIGFGSARPLIDTGKLRSSFSYKISGKDKVIIYIESGRSRIGGYLQNDGIKTLRGKKYYKFFGISKDAFRRSMAYAKNKVKEITSGGGKK